MVRIPSEYQEVEWIKTPDADNAYNVYICTNIANSNISRVIIKYHTIAYNQSNSPIIIASHNTGKTAAIDPYAAVSGIASKGLVITPRTAKPFAGVTDIYTITYPEETTGNLRIGGWSDKFWSAEGAYYYVKVFNRNDELMTDLIPCYRKSDNEPGMYDTVTGTFYTNSGTGSFTVGNDVSYSTTNLTETRRKIILNSPHIEAASGNICTFSTDMTAKLKSCRVNFLPKQAGSGDPSPDNVRAISGWDGVTVYRSGKNLFDEANYNYITAYPSSGKLISASATRIVYIPCKPNTTYTATNGAGNDRKTIITTASVPTPGDNYLDGSSNGTITTGSDAKYIGVYCYNSNVDTVTFEEVVDSLQIEIGTEPTAYEPCTAETLSVTFPAQGKNLFDVTSYPLSESGFYVAGSNGVYATTTAAMKATFVFVPCSEYQGMTLTLNKRPGGSSAGIAFYSSADQSTYISGYNNNGATANTSWTFVVPDNANYMRFTVPSDANDIQIELGSTATTYEPYTNAVYGGYLDLTSGELWANMICLDMGKMSWSKSNDLLFRTFGSTLPAEPKTYPRYYMNINWLCSRYKIGTVNSEPQSDKTMCCTLNSSTVILKDSDFETAAELKSALDGAQFVYELATPQLIATLTPTQIKTLKGINNVYSDADNINVTYYRH